VNNAPVERPTGALNEIFPRTTASSNTSRALRSEIAQLEARYDFGAMPRSIYEVLKRMRAELARRTAEESLRWGF